MKREFEDVVNALNNLAKRLEYEEYKKEPLKLEQPISDDQTKQIKSEVKALGKKIIGNSKRLLALQTRKIYRYLNENYNLATPISNTKKKDFECILQGIKDYEAFIYKKDEDTTMTIRDLKRLTKDYDDDQEIKIFATADNEQYVLEFEGVGGIENESKVYFFAKE